MPTSEEIYTEYVSLGFKSNKKLLAYNKFLHKTDPKVINKELVYYRKSIRFVYTKLVSMLSNQNIWSSCTNLTTLPAYIPNHTDLALTNELIVLKDYKKPIIARLNRIDDKTLFMVDLKLLANNLDKLDASFERLTKRYEQHADHALTYYSIAS